MREETPPGERGALPALLAPVPVPFVLIFPGDGVRGLGPGLVLPDSRWRKYEDEAEAVRTRGMGIADEDFEAVSEAVGVVIVVVRVGVSG